MKENGHIYAPVNADDVASVLGENSHDVGTLCTSVRINPYSLIRPSYASHPGFGPEHFENGFDSTRMPESGSEDWFYTKGRWGYAVPTVGNPQSIDVIKDKPWVHFDPAGDSFLCMPHFDGYRHDVKSRLPVSAAIMDGAPISVIIVADTAQENILSPTGRGNNGGVVAVPEVLGAVRLGCTIYENGTYRGSFMGSVTTEESTTGVHTITTSVTAHAGRRYTVIPWATDGSSVTQARARFFGLMYAEDFRSELEATPTRRAFPSIGLRCTNESSYKQAGVIYLEITLTNPAESDISQAAFSDFRLVKGSNTEVSSSAFWLEDAAPRVAKGSTATVTARCTDADLLTAVLATVRVRAKCEGEQLESNAIFLGDFSGAEIE